MGKLADDKRKALLKARLEKQKQDIIIEETKPQEMIIDTVFDMSCLWEYKRVGRSPTSASLGCYSATDLYFVKIRFLKRGKTSWNNTQ